MFDVIDERKLDDRERPLIVQLNWGNDDREGRFLLKKETDPTLLVSLSLPTGWHRNVWNVLFSVGVY